jgi:hypothetical protein
MSSVLLLDFETSSADPAVALPWEVAAVPCNGDDWRAIREREFQHAFMNTRMWDPGYPDLSDEVLTVCKIEERSFPDAPHPREVLTKLADAMSVCDYAMAYNAAYDRQVFENACAKYKVAYPVIDWVCAYSDVPYPERFRCRQLTHLALDHGCTVDGSTAHGALSDVFVMIELLFTGGYTLEKILQFRDDPWVIIAAKFNAFNPGGQEIKEAVKAAGYGWQSPRGSNQVFEKRWVKRVKKSRLEEEKAQPFPCPREILKGE